MSLDGTPEQNAIETRLANYLLSGRVHTFLPEETQLEIDDDTGLVLPYIVLSFGSLYPLGSDRSIEGADQQPQIMPVIVECWAANAPAARSTAGAVRTRLVGWLPDANNASELELRGGGWFEQRDASGRPTRFMESVNLTTILNMSIVAP